MEYLRYRGFVLNSENDEVLSGVASLAISINKTSATSEINESWSNNSVVANYIWLRCKATIIDDSEYEFDSFKMTVSAPDVPETEYTSPGYKEPDENAYSSVLEGDNREGWNIYDLIEGHTQSSNSKRALITFYAYFRPRLQQVTLSFDANGGTGAPDSISAEQGVFLIPNTEPTRRGYEFLGWALSASATDKQYSPGQTINIQENTILYAVWQDGSGPSPGPTPEEHSGYLTRNKSYGYLEFVPTGHLVYD